jgi:hypothetical protein
VTIGEHVERFGGLSVVTYSPEGGVASPRSNAFRLSLDWEAFDEGQKFSDLFSAFVSDPACVEVAALIIGDWGGVGQGEGSEPVIEALVSARDRLPKLKSLFIGELTVEESEISWINQSDVSPLFEAFPQLEELWLRGGNGLSLGRPRHQKLTTLVIETGGMPATIVREIATADLPSLRHLELWLGDDGYGNDVTTEDLQTLLTAPCFQKLNYVGLKNDCHADATAKLLAASDMPATIEQLDLSMGTLGDEGASALLASGWLRRLKKLDIHHHYVSPEQIERLKAVVPEVDASDPCEPDTWNGESNRYVAVSE